MSVISKIHAYSGVFNYLSRYDIGEIDQLTNKELDRYINNLLVNFLRKSKIRYTKNNSRNYKGNFNPVLENSYRVQLVFKDFTKYVNENYKLKQ